MPKILDWIKKHSWQTVLIGFGSFLLPLILVHIAYRIPSITPWFSSTWDSGDLITYIAGFEAFLGTVLLGVIAVNQNQRAINTNELLLDATNKQHKVERQLLHGVSKCEVKTDANRKQMRTFSQYTVKYKEIPNNYDESTMINTSTYITVSFELTSYAKLAYAFSLMRVSLQNIDSSTYNEFINFKLVRFDETICSLNPNEAMKFIFELLDKQLEEKGTYLFSIILKFTNIIGENIEEEFRFLIINNPDQKRELQFYGYTTLR